MRHLAILLALFSQIAFGALGELPGYKALQTQLGWTFTKSIENFDDETFRVDFSNFGHLCDFKEHKFFVGAEYGFAPNLSFAAMANYIFNSSINSQTDGTLYLYGGGISDVLISGQYNITPTNPLLTAEAILKIPTYGRTPKQNGDLVLGDGSFDIKALIHTGVSWGPLVAVGTPGFVGRFGGYAPAFVLETDIRARNHVGYIGVFTNLYYSISDEKGNDSTLKIHDAPGSGGSYMRLAGGPTYFTMGGRVAGFLNRTLGLEASFEKATWGFRAGNFFKFQLTLFNLFDFYEPPKSKKIKNVPFDPKGDSQ